ncbi:quinone oxidoreductase family protein [Streptomyces iconiensis]|uniref:Quinone oxidoreductase n=1 Tax=Streptomyces iconiensis TaxID=1384038 RepID=A0ABT6ZVA4_9ACTN|nr:quinone oxidoreductase [Streptomyces iconiensis]MDJ1132744.1 quinone oxidoreductase [Streptomyces iconiensis]
MRAVVVREFGSPDVLRVEETADPLPGAGELLVAVEAAGVNFMDVYRRSGAYPGPLPFVPGAEAAGTVLAVGPEPESGQEPGGGGRDGDGDGAGRGPAPGGWDRHRVGDRVAWANQPGGYAELAVIRAERAVPVPSGLSLSVAAAVLLQGMTAHYLTHDTYPVRPGDTVLVHAAAGGMGLLLTQLATLRGGRVIGVVSTEAKEKTARAAGAWQVLRTGEGRGAVADVAAMARELTGGVGVAAVYDGVGAPTFEASLASLRTRGTLALFGQAGGRVPPVDLQRLNTAGSVFVTRPNLDHYTATAEELAHRAGGILGPVADGRVDVHIGGSFPLEAAGEAHRALESRASTGKLLLTTSAGTTGASTSTSTSTANGDTP